MSPLTVALSILAFPSRVFAISQSPGLGTPFSLYNATVGTLFEPKAALSGGYKATVWTEGDHTDRVIKGEVLDYNNVSNNGTLNIDLSYGLHRRLHLCGMANGNFTLDVEELVVSDGDYRNEAWVIDPEGEITRYRSSPIYEDDYARQDPSMLCPSWGISFTALGGGGGDGWTLYQRSWNNNQTVKASYGGTSLNVGWVSSGLFERPRQLLLGNGNLFIAIGQTTNPAGYEINPLTKAVIGSKKALDPVVCSPIKNVELASIGTGKFAMIGECGGGIWIRYFFDDITPDGDDFQVASQGTMPVITTVDAGVLATYQTPTSVVDVVYGVNKQVLAGPLDIADRTSTLNDAAPAVAAIGNQVFQAFIDNGHVMVLDINVTQLLLPPLTLEPTPAPTETPPTTTMAVTTSTQEPTPAPTDTPTTTTSGVTPSTQVPTTSPTDTTPLTTSRIVTSTAVSRSSPTGTPPATTPIIDTTTARLTSRRVSTIASDHLMIRQTVSVPTSDEETGDGTTATIIVSVMLLFLSCIIGIAYGVRKRKRNRPKSPSIIPERYQSLPFTERSRNSSRSNVRLRRSSEYNTLKLGPRPLEDYARVNLQAQPNSTYQTVFPHAYDDAPPPGQVV